MNTPKTVTISCACRSFFVYKDGPLFMQIVEFNRHKYTNPTHKRTHYEDVRNTILSLRYNQPVVIKLPSVIVNAKFVAIKGTGILLKDWTFESTEYNIYDRSKWIDTDDGFMCARCGHKVHFGDDIKDPNHCPSCHRRMES